MAVRWHEASPSVMNWERGDAVAKPPKRGRSAAAGGKNATINKHTIFNQFNMWPVSVGNLFAIVPY